MIEFSKNIFHCVKNGNDTNIQDSFSKKIKKQISNKYKYFFRKITCIQDH